MEERLEAYEMWIYRRIGKVSWTERKTNEYVLRMLGIKKQLLNIVKERKLKYYGHIKRHQTVQRITLEGKVEGKRSRGKQRLKWEDNIKGWTKRSMEECGRLAKDRANHLRCLTDLVDAQMNYYYECYQCMNELQKELASTSLGNFGANSSAHPNLFSNSSSTELGTNKRRAKVLYDYDAQDSTELSLLAEEVITVSNAQGLDSDWLMGERGGQKGKVPKAYLNFSL
ncbi:Endophilin-B1 [Nymphon striatum]|nr:Endophilin-B1 [Nymphon striatum]